MLGKIDSPLGFEQRGCEERINILIVNHREKPPSEHYVSYVERVDKTSHESTVNGFGLPGKRCRVGIRFDVGVRKDGVHCGCRWRAVVQFIESW